MLRGYLFVHLNPSVPESESLGAVEIENWIHRLWIHLDCRPCSVERPGMNNRFTSIRGAGCWSDVWRYGWMRIPPACRTNKHWNSIAYLPFPGSQCHRLNHHHHRHHQMQITAWAAIMVHRRLIAF